jgi:hypothetical protein
MLHQIFIRSLRNVIFLVLIFSSSILSAKDGIVISGQPGSLANKKHFLENGLDRCLKYRNAFKRENRKEKVTWLIFNSGNIHRGGYPEDILKEYTEKAEKENIEVVILNSSNKIVNFMNRKSTFDDSLNLISRLHYYGHATPGKLEIGYVNNRFYNKIISKKLNIEKINATCFSDSAVINVVGGCRTAIRGGLFFKKSVAEKLMPLTNGKIIATDVRVFYPGGPVSDKTLVKKNSGNIIEVQGRKINQF